MCILSKIKIRERFFSYIRKTNSCWLWTGYVRENGYANFRYKDSTWRAHRVSYDLFVGPIPKGKMVLHKCDVKECVRPEHLYIGDHARNMRDVVERKRQWYHPPKGHLSGEKNPKAKLSNDDVEFIRTNYVRYKNFGMNSIALSKKYGVSPSTILRVVEYKNWINQEAA